MLNFLEDIISSCFINSITIIVPVAARLQQIFNTHNTDKCIHIYTILTRCHFFLNIMINIFIIVTVLTIYFNNYRIYSQMKWKFELNEENK